MKILFVRPPLTKPFMEIKSHELPSPGEPYGILLLGAILSKDHDVGLLDMEFDSDLERKLESFQPQLVGVSCFFVPLVYECQDILKRVKRWNPEVYTVVGGKGATFLPEAFNRDEVDAIVIGEGEVTIKELVSTIEQRRDFRKVNGIAYRKDGNLLFTESRPLIENLNELPFPNRRLCRKYKYRFRPLKLSFWQIESGRGCVHNYKFCCLHRRGIYQRSAEEVVRQIEEMPYPFVIDFSVFTVVTLAELERRADLMKERGIHKRGLGINVTADGIYHNPRPIQKLRGVCDMLNLYVDWTSPDEEFYKKYNKPFSPHANESIIRLVQEYDINLHWAFIVDTELDEDGFKRVKDFVESAPAINVPHFQILTPLPGTQLYKENYNKIIVKDWRYFDLYHAVVPTKLPPETFQEHYDSLRDLEVSRRLSFGMSHFAPEEIDYNVVIEQHKR